ncbi:AAA family ATPase [Methylobacterium sp. Leaf465]|uniref:AAA family ATPase n=1 Tax=Methylobacterium sp. Leaf465 TaxID=1736385 RepID=UPI000AAA7253|nr:AAA family ATPase [Methylobacterium sp. Leaf465]
MRLKTTWIRNYHSIRDTRWFADEDGKTILVGPNEAGKTAILQALQQLSKPEGVKGFDGLRDYLHALAYDITRGVVTSRRPSSPRPSCAGRDRTRHQISCTGRGPAGRRSSRQSTRC